MRNARRDRWLTGLMCAAGVATLTAAAARADVIFQDGFESGNITAGGWTSSGAATVDGSSYSGNYAARIDDSGYFRKVVSTQGYEQIELEYARYTYGYDLGEELTVQWSTNGTSWNTVETYKGGWAVNQVSLGAGAANQPTLYIRFISDANGTYERFRIDDVAVLGCTGAGCDGGGGGGDTCLPQVQNYRGSGPFGYTTDQLSVGFDDVNVWIPTGLPSGCRVPIVHIANGTGATCSTYGSLARHFASHGFVTACYEDTNTGQGTQAIDAIEAVIDEYGDIVDTKYGFTGHSQGGGGAILGVYRAEQQWGSAREYAGLGIEPAHGFGDSPSNWATLYGEIYSPIAMFNGSADTLVSATWVRSGYDALDDNLDKAWYEAVGAAHIPPPNTDAGEMGVAWFRWQLLGDSDACEHFADMPSSSDWRLQETDNLSDCN
jgi:hypothetical protein